MAGGPLPSSKTQLSFSCTSTYRTPVFGKADPRRATAKDLFYLWCLRRDVPVSTPCFLLATFKSVITNTNVNMCLGDYITAIAAYFGVFDPLDTDMTVLPTRALALTAVNSDFKCGKCSRAVTEELSSSSDQADGEDNSPVASNAQSAEPSTVDNWMLISRKLDQMQTQMKDAMDARFDGLEKKLFNAMCACFQTFEREWVDLRQDESNGTKTVGKMKQENFVANRTIKKLRLEKLESDKAAEMYKTRLQKFSQRIKTIEEGHAKISSMKAVDLINLVNDMREPCSLEEGGNSELADLRGKNDRLGNRSTAVDDVEDVVALFPEVRLTSISSGSKSKGLSEKGDRNSPQPLTREQSEHDIAHTIKNSPGLQSGHNPHLPGSEECIEPLGSAARDIIEILDSDDETKPNAAAESSKRVLRSDEMNPVQRSKRNRTESMENLFAFSTTKVKKEVRTVDEDNELIHEKGNKVLKSSHDRVGCSPSGRCVDKARYSQNGLNDQVSAASEDGSLSDSEIDDLIASLRRENRIRKFMHKADMLQAFQQDDELCLNAVCALYRQKFSTRKSNGFSPIDSMSGCVFAEYLIGGDKELRLTKSVSQVKRQRPDVITLCRKLAITYVEKLFELHCAGDDPLFC